MSKNQKAGNKETKKPLVTVLGILGKQGYSVASSLLHSGEYRVKGITRRLDDERLGELKALGLEIVSIPLTIGYEREFRAAFQGSSAVFLLTPNTPPNGSNEFELGIELANAANDAGVSHIIFSSLENVEKITNGNKFAPHFTDKAKIEEYIRTLAIKSTFIQMAFFFTNLIEFYTPVQRGDSLVFPLYLPENFKAPFVDPLTATGSAVLEILSHPDSYYGKTVPVVGEILSPKEIIATFNKITGKNAVYANAYTREGMVEYFPEYKSNELLLDEIIGMVEYAVEYGYFTKDKNLSWGRAVNPGILNWEKFLKAYNWQGEKRLY